MNDTAIMRCIHTGRAGFRYSGVDTAIMRCIHTGRATPGFRYSGVDTAIMRCIHTGPHLALDIQVWTRL